MKVLDLSMWVVLGGAGIGGYGCDVFVGGHPQYGPPVYVEQQPQYVEPQPQYIFVQQAPPPIIVERRPPPPSGVHVWVDGYWNWSNQRYSWEAGRYTLPPQQGAVWVAPRYEKDTRGQRYTPGQWKKQDQKNGHGKDRH